LFTCWAKTAKDQLQGQREYKTAPKANKHENKFKSIEVIYIWGQALRSIYQFTNPGVSSSACSWRTVTGWTTERSKSHACAEQKHKTACQQGCTATGKH
jgi:hypothetical protein